MITSLINYKGGVGKTTLTANIAVCLALKGKKVLMLDLDPQASLTFSFMSAEKCRDKKDIKSLFDAYANDRVPPSRADLTTKLSDVNKIYNDMHLHLIPSSLSLPEAELSLAAVMDRYSVRRQQMSFVAVHSILTRFLNSVENDYDYVFIDCPPNLNIITKNALVASDYYLIPTKLDYLSTVGIPEMKMNITRLQAEYNNIVERYSLRKKKMSAEALGIICTMVGYFNGVLIQTNQEYLRQIKVFGIPILKSSIRENKTHYGSVTQYGYPMIMKKDKDPTCTELRKEIENITLELERELNQLVTNPRHA